MRRCRRNQRPRVRKQVYKVLWKEQVVSICFFLLCGYCKQRRLSDEQREVRNGHLVQQIVIWCSELTITNAFSDIINKICDWK